ncbi:hypothetical protein JVU11DRAFT_9451 [Chiua virens]|nr:hypothetical protein JVU11DRAFT_9451 [Chiua virens]
MQGDPDNKWSKQIFPSIIMWYGDQANIWNIKEPDLECALITIVGVVYLSFDDINAMKHGGAIYNLAVQHLVRWQHIIGNAAGHVVFKHLNEKATNEDITKEAEATCLLKDHMFAYEDLV